MADTRFKAENGLLVAGDTQLTANVEVGGVLYTTDGGFIANSSLVRTLHPLTIANTAVALANVQIEGTLTGNAVVAVSVDTGSLHSGNNDNFLSANTTEVIVANIATTFISSNVSIQSADLAVTAGNVAVNGSTHTISGNVNFNAGQFVLTNDKNLAVDGGTITMVQGSLKYHAVEIDSSTSGVGPVRFSANTISFNWNEATNTSFSNTTFPYAMKIAHSQNTGALVVSSGVNATSTNGALIVVDTLIHNRTSTTVNTELTVTQSATFSNTVVVNGSQLTSNSLVVKNATTAQGTVTFESNATMNVASTLTIGNSTVNAAITNAAIVIANSTVNTNIGRSTASFANSTLTTTINPGQIDVGSATTVANGSVNTFFSSNSYASSRANATGSFVRAQYTPTNTAVNNTSFVAITARPGSAANTAEVFQGWTANSTLYAGMVVSNDPGSPSQFYFTSTTDTTTITPSSVILTTQTNPGQRVALRQSNGVVVTYKDVAGTDGGYAYLSANTATPTLGLVSTTTANVLITPTDILAIANTSTRTAVNSTAFSVITGTTASNSIIAAFTSNATGYPLVSFTSGTANVLLGTAGLTMGNSSANATVNQTGLWFNGTGIGLANVSIDGSTGTLNLGVSTIYGSGWAVFNGNTALGLPFGNTATRPTINRTAYLRYNSETDQPEISNTGAWNYVVTSSIAGKASVTATANTVVQRNITGDIYANNFYSTSDVTLKQNLVQITGALDKLEQITGWMYNFIGDDKTQLGVSAQQVEKTIPEVVGTNEQGLKSVSYQMLIPVIIESIKELKQKLDEITDGGKNKPRN